VFRTIRAAAVATALGLVFLAGPASALTLPQGVDPQNAVVLTLKDGPVVIKLRPDLAPKTVAQIKTLTKRGFYDGLVFHRVIAGFMAQTGDPTGTGTSGSDLPNVPAEFSSAHFARGTLGMARASDPNSGNSQFFIMFADGAFLDGQYTVFGEVVSGMDAVDKIKKGAREQNGTVSQPDKIIKMQMASDVK
jgi:peptidylprolyl isomerase